MVRLLRRPDTGQPQLLREASLPGSVVAFLSFPEPVETLDKTNWVVGGTRGTARRLGVPRTTLIHKMSKLGIARDSVHDMSNGDGSMWAAPLSQRT